MYKAEGTITKPVNIGINMSPQQPIVSHREDDQLSFVADVPGFPESLVIKNFSHKTEFGWVFPELSQSQAKEPVVVDSKWLAEYSEEIEALQGIIYKQSLLSDADHGQSNFAETLKTEIKYQSTSNFSYMRHDYKETCNSKVKRSSNRRNQNNSVKRITTNEANFNDSGFEEELITEKEETKSSSRESETEGEMISEESPVARNECMARCSTPQSEACYSMTSCTSRDSGVYVSDDVSECQPEAQPEKSLLQELEEIFNNRVTQPDRCLTHKAEFEAVAAISDEETRNKCPIWFQKFSGDGSLGLRLSPLAWDPGTIRDEVSAQSINREVENESVSSTEDTVSEEAGVDKISENTKQERQLANLLTTCDRLEALSLRSSSVGAVAEVIKLAKSFSKINDRLQNLRFSLQGLSLQAHENKHDLSNLEVRASGLLSSTSASRRHLTQAWALQRLEDRLQEEWWAAYDPNALNLHENYIV
ncbi:uncharacterized protein [Procambarus clarkii]|uniref:uncharacterized protein isoform X1 n=1 Tax=Procambarus clarkii TaxID=6728 RepID=UPI001E66FE0F|nr:uncharacterized protein LOC123746013 isoform X1 [Procambarus clarkii]